MALFTISDLHLALADESKKMDVFERWENYVEKINKNWRLIVKEEDTVVVIGDISWAIKLEESKKDLEFLNSLPGKKVLIKGNHDLWWGTTKKVNDFFKKNNFNKLSIVFNSAEVAEGVAICGTRGWFFDCEEECDKKVLNRELARLENSIAKAKETGLQPIVFLHYPPIYSESECKEIINILVKHNIKECYYGHIHGGLSSKSAYIGKYKCINKFMLVSCDYLNFTPYLIKK